VYNPLLRELFTAEKRKGAYLNNVPIRPSQTNKISESLLCTGFPYDIRTSTENNLNHFERFSSRAQAVRRSGTAALELCYVAAGRFDGFWELKLNPWDTAAASLIVEEAGGVLTSFSGTRYSIYSDEILASNGKIHEEMVKILTGGE
ncbi:MAG: inositol monophosphatase family protein, partial [Nitrospinota bacterium]